MREGDFGTFTLYPSCPTQLRIMQLWMERRRTLEDGYFNGFIGREAYDIFARAGLEDIAIEAFVPPLSCNYPGSDHYEWRRESFKRWLSPDARRSKVLLEDGTIDQAMADRAAEEVRAWFEHPSAFFMMTSVLAVGTVP